MKLFVENTYQVKPEIVLKFWNKYAKLYKWKEVRGLSTVRKQAIRCLVHEHGVQGMKDCLRMVKKSRRFLSGKAWFTLDWLLIPDNFCKVIEGKYATSFETVSYAGDSKVNKNRMSL